MPVSVGSNIVVLDTETLKSADACRFCDDDQGEHALKQCHVYTPIGWEDHARLGLSIGCMFDYRDMRLHFFDGHTLAAWMRVMVVRQPCLVTFNGLGFDVPLLCAVLRQEAHAGPSAVYAESIDDLCWRFQALAEQGYDLLAAIWAVDPERKFARGLNSLGVIAPANGFGSKEMDGALAPRLWAQGRRAEVIDYCASDVDKTRRLFELVVNKGGLLRGDQRWLALPRPILPEEGSMPPCPDCSGLAWGTSTSGFNQAADMQSATGAYVAVPLPGTLLAHQWYHVGVTGDSTTLSLYLNGVQRNAAVRRYRETHVRPPQGSPRPSNGRC